MLLLLALLTAAPIIIIAATALRHHRACDPAEPGPITTVCMDCGTHIRGPARDPLIPVSHGLCPTCAATRRAAIAADHPSYMTPPSHFVPPII